MSLLSSRLARPIYFVLGNHDYYHGSIAEVRESVAALCRRDPWLRWLPGCGVVELSNRAALIGHGGWGDARLGNVDTTPVRLNDFFYIRELFAASGAGNLEATLQALGDEAAAYIRTTLEQACAGYQKLVMMTHVPPFRAACWHDGQVSDDDWLPYFTCHAVGETIVDVMARHPNTELTVLCGHTHSAGTVHVADNVVVETGAADYGLPRINRIIEIG
jgi:hypothetical protein